MTRYLVENKGLGDFETAFPHTPTDHAASLQDYIEDKFANGYELVTLWERAGSDTFIIFRVIAK